LVLIIFAAYYPVWHGAPLWDDSAHLAAPESLNGSGLLRIWTEPTATQQYYPVVHSVFWLLATIVGHKTLVYHLLNIGLHATSALLVAAIVRDLGVRGGLLAGAVFALHPVHVESVAWISELKNVLSTAFYLAAAFTYLRYERSRSPKHYGIALTLFLLAILSKTVTVTLPVAMLTIIWWKRRHLVWRRDILPLLPYTLIGLVAGIFTVWIERVLIGATGADYSLSILERALLAGRVPWFYFGTLLWPTDLSFNYPRWDLNSTEAMQYLPLVSLLAVLAFFSVFRHRWRGALASTLFFLVTLFPALGFFNVYPFRYSFVADHFQYMASLGVIVPFSTMVAGWGARILPVVARSASVALIVSVLACLTWARSHDFRSPEALYEATLRTNPNSWMAHLNLGALLLDPQRSDLPKAISHLRDATRLQPTSAEANYNLGLALFQAGAFAESEIYLKEALRLEPRYTKAKVSLAMSLAASGRRGQAIEILRDAISVAPDDIAARNNLGTLLAEAGRVHDAIEHFSAVITVEPQTAAGYLNLAAAYMSIGSTDAADRTLRLGISAVPNALELYNARAELLISLDRPQDAINLLEPALIKLPRDPDALNTLGVALARSGRHHEAIGKYDEALRSKPDAPDVLANRGLSLVAIGRVDDAIAAFAQSLRMRPTDNDVRLLLAQALAQKGRLQEALVLVNRIIEESGPNANADARRLQQAIETQLRRPR
jgi:tetratricopeptide (TPR) repeat protein